MKQTTYDAEIEVLRDIAMYGCIDIGRFEIKAGKKFWAKITIKDYGNGDTEEDADVYFGRVTVHLHKGEWKEVPYEE